MIKELYKIRLWLLIASLVIYIGSIIMTLIGEYCHIDLDLQIALGFIFGMVLFVLAVIYPLIYKAELMIGKMEDEEDKKKHLK